MPSESLITEFVSLIRDTREQLAYLHELGVMNVETELQASSSTRKAVAAEPKEIHTQVLSDSYYPSWRGTPDQRPGS